MLLWRGFCVRGRLWKYIFALCYVVQVIAGRALSLYRILRFLLVDGATSKQFENWSIGPQMVLFSMFLLSYSCVLFRCQPPLSPQLIKLKAKRFCKSNAAVCIKYMLSIQIFIDSDYISSFISTSEDDDLRWMHLLSICSIIYFEKYAFLPDRSGWFIVGMWLWIYKLS